MDKKQDSVLKFIFLKDLNSGEGDSNGVYTFIASKEIVDRDGDIVRVKGIDLTNYKKNPIVMSVHSWNKLPIGKTVKTEKTADSLLMSLSFSELTDGQNAKTLIDEGILNAVSIGFSVKRGDKSVYYNSKLADRWGLRVDSIKTFEDLKNDDPVFYSLHEKDLKVADKVFYNTELFEVSLVPIPANQDALLVSASKGVSSVYVKSAVDNNFMLVDIEQIKSVVPFSSPGIASEPDSESGWSAPEAIGKLKQWASSDGSGNKDKISWKKFKNGFTWFDSSKINNLGSYKLPHHSIENDKFSTLWSGVHTAMGSLLGSRGGVAIPEADRKGVYNHLSKHYKQFNKIVPTFKVYSIIEALDTLDNDTARSIIVNTEIEDIKLSLLNVKTKSINEILSIKEELEKIKEEKDKLQTEIDKLSEDSNVPPSKQDVDKEHSFKYRNVDRGILKNLVKGIAIKSLNESN